MDIFGAGATFWVLVRDRHLRLFRAQLRATAGFSCVPRMKRRAVFFRKTAPSESFASGCLARALKEFDLFAELMAQERLGFILLPALMAVSRRRSFFAMSRKNWGSFCGRRFSVVFSKYVTSAAEKT